MHESTLALQNLLPVPCHVAGRLAHDADRISQISQTPQVKSGQFRRERSCPFLMRWEV